MHSTTSRRTRNLIRTAFVLISFVVVLGCLLIPSTAASSPGKPQSVQISTSDYAVIDVVVGDQLCVTTHKNIPACGELSDGVYTIVGLSNLENVARLEIIREGGSAIQKITASKIRIEMRCAEINYLGRAKKQAQ